MNIDFSTILVIIFWALLLVMFTLQVSGQVAIGWGWVLSPIWIAWLAWMIYLAWFLIRNRY